MALIEIPDIQVGAGRAEIDEWWDAAHTAYRNQPQIFEEYMSAHPDMAIRWYARAANSNVNADGNRDGILDGADNKFFSEKAEMLSYQVAYDLGYGADMKQDGKMVAWNYDDWNDITNEWGAGDFWKIGQPASMNGGLNDFVEDNPLKIAAIIGSIFIPQLAPLVASSLGVSVPVASGLLSAGMSAVGGGDLTDIVTAGLTSWGLGELSEWSTEALANLPEHEQTAEALKILDEQGVVMSSADTVTDPNMIINFANEAIDGTRAAAEVVGDVNGFGVVNAYGELNEAYGNYNDGQYQVGDVQVPGSSGSYDNPVLDYPNAPSLNPNAGGSTTTSGPTQGDPSGTPEEAGTPEPPGGLLPGTSEGDLNTPGETKDRDHWTLDYGLLTNLDTGETRTPGAGMKPGVIYSGDGDVISGGEEEAGPGTPIHSVSNLPDGRSLSLGGMPTYGPGSPNPYPGDGGSGSEGGSGVGDGHGDGTQDPTDPGFEFPNIPIPIPVPGGGGDDGYNVNVPPQDMSTLYEKPTYDPAPTRDLLSVPPREMQPPMITPADNSGQASYEEWLNDYLAQPRTQEGLLPMIAGKQTNGGLL